MEQNQVKTSQGDEGETAATGSSGSPRPALEQCPHCKKMVANVYIHTAHEDCDVINEQIARLIAEGVSDDFRPT